jgi:hypothetical protein
MAYRWRDGISVTQRATVTARAGDAERPDNARDRDDQAI